MSARVKRQDGPSLFDTTAKSTPPVIPVGTLLSADFAVSADDPPTKAARIRGGDIPVDTLEPDYETPLNEKSAARAKDAARAEKSTPADKAESSPRGPAKRERVGATAETMATKQREISVSEFFAKNRHLLGFDNKRKALLTTVKEAVDNSLDACEEAGILPEIEVSIEQKSEERFRVTIRDNGPGIVRAQIPNVFGKLLYGSKFHRLKMSRGQQGIGISAAGMYGLLTTGQPVHITSRTSAKKPAHHFQLAIDTTKNRPDVVADMEQEVDWDHGTQVAIELIASYQKGRQSVDEYLEQTAMANPHAAITYRAPTGEVRIFERAAGATLPAETKEIQPHPHGIELGVLMKMLKEARPREDGERTPKLSGFLQNEFCRVSSRVAEEICNTAKLSTKAATASLSTPEIERLYQAMQTVKIQSPPTDCLAPIGVRQLLGGMLKEVKAEFYAATTRDPAVYRGNPFQMEIAIAYGGALPADQQARVVRFANRVPLLYQQSACAAFKSVLDVDWRNYGISQPGGGAPVAPLVVMVHMASVWVPFTSESKEAIADYDEIRKEMKLALQECGRKLATYIRRRRKQQLESDRRDIFERYIPDVSEALAALAGVDANKTMVALQRIARRRTADADVELDEDGRKIEKPTGDAVGANGKTPDAAADVEAFAGDESVVVIPENAVAPAPAEGLFDDAEAGKAEGGGKRRRKRGS